MTWRRWKELAPWQGSRISSDAGFHDGGQVVAQTAEEGKGGDGSIYEGDACFDDTLNVFYRVYVVHLPGQRLSALLVETRYRVR